MISGQQRKALHVGFQIIADQLNELGHGMHVVLNTKRDKFLINIFNTIIDLCQKAIEYLESKDSIHVAWDKDRIKDALFKPIIKAKYKLNSTTQLNPTQLNDAWDDLNEILLNNGYLERAIDFPREKE